MTLNTTANERRMLDNIWHNDYGHEGDAVWSNCLDCGPHGDFINRRGFGGIVASLVKKGLVWADGGSDAESCVGLTAAGTAFYMTNAPRSVSLTPDLLERAEKERT